MSRAVSSIKSSEPIETHRNPSELIWTHRNPSEPIEQTYPSPTTQFLVRKGQIWLWHENWRMGHTMRISHLGQWVRDREWPLIMRNNFLSEGTQPILAVRPNFLSEGVRFGSETKTGGWDILDVFPIRQFDWRVEDDPLSQEILIIV